MSRFTEAVGRFYTSDYIYPKTYGTGALGFAAVSGVCELVTGMSETTQATAGWAGGLVVLAVFSAILETLTEHNRSEY
jgi:hypothetical protein